jgi:hypothetical protein
MKKWAMLLNLNDHRLVRCEKATTAMACISEWMDGDKLVRYRIGDDWGVHKVDAESLEKTAIHEMLHVRLHPMIQAIVGYGEDSEESEAAEHAVIIVVENLLYELVQATQALEALRGHQPRV